MTFECFEGETRATTRSEPLYSKKLEGSVVCTVRSGLTTDTRPTGFVAFQSYETLNCKRV